MGRHPEPPSHAWPAGPHSLPWPLVLPLLVRAACGGCDIRDESVPAGDASSLWPAAVLDPAGARTEAGGEPAARPAIEYVEGYEAAVRRARAEGLPMLLIFRATWCRWSGEVTHGPLNDRTVVALARRFVCVTVDADRDAATCRTFSVAAFPTVIVLDAAGEERFRATGAAAADGLATALKGVAEGGTAARIAGGKEEPSTR